MQAVLPIAGKSTRMAAHYQGAKQLLPVAGKPLVEYTLSELPDVITELVLIVGGPYEDQVRTYFKDEHNGRKITYVRQEEQKGLGHAIQQAKDVVKGKFLVLVPDDVYAKEDLEKVIAQEDLGALAQRHDHPEHFGVFLCDDKGCIMQTVEKPKEFVSDLISAGACYLLDDEFFTVTVPPSARGEIELPDIVNALIKERSRTFRIVEATFWMPVNTPEQLKEAERILSNRP